MEKLIYLLEDDESICELIECSIKIKDYHVRSFNTIKDFNDAFEKNLPEMVILDIMLTDGSGLDVLAKIKQQAPDLYVIMLSALGKEKDKVKGLDLGADDYIAKPFGILELNAKIKAVLRRIGAGNQILIVDNIKINRSTQEVFVDDKKIKISNKEFILVEYLIKNKNQVLARDSILEKVFGFDSGEARTIDNYIAHLRKEGITNIKTVYGVGYTYKGGQQ